MHISEGILSAPVLISGGVLTLAGTAVGLKSITSERIMPVAILSASFFIASLIHVPLGPGSIHLLLNGLLGIILGWAAFPAILTALLLQAILFQYGGIVVLGINTLIQALPAVLCFYLFRPGLMKGDSQQKIASFCAGFFAVFFSALSMASCLAMTDKGFFQTSKLVVAANIPIMFIEGIVTMFVVSFLMKVQPEILALQVQEEDEEK
jgi:cobalt/nickel transport system permease protein